MSNDAVLLDTSVAIPLIVEDHVSHKKVFNALDGYSLGLAGHAVFETLSVLTRLPGKARRSSVVASQIVNTGFPRTVYPSSDETAALVNEISDLGINGGAIYDALVGLAARSAGLPLVTRDKRALPTYRLLGCELRLLA